METETAPLFKSVVLELWVLQEFFAKLLAAVKFLHKDSDINVRLLWSGGADFTSFGQVSIRSQNAS